MNKWFSMRAEAPDGYAAEIELNEGIGYWGMTAGDFIAQAKAIKGRVLVRINSGGGSIFDAVAIYNYLRSRKGGADTVVDGVAASAATIVMLAGEQRSMGTGSFVMVHRAMADTFGNAAEIRKAADDLEKIEDGIRAIYAERTGADDDQLSEWLNGEDHWLNAADATDTGFATETFEQLRAVASFDIQAKFTSAPPPVVAALTQPQQKDNDMKIVMKTLGLSEDANEAAAIEAVNKLKADVQAATELAQEQEQLVATLANQLNEIKAKVEAEAKAAAEKSATELVEASGFTGDKADALMQLALVNYSAAKTVAEASAERHIASAETVPAADVGPKLTGMDAVRAAFKSQI